MCNLSSRLLQKTVCFACDQKLMFPSRVFLPKKNNESNSHDSCSVDASIILNRLKPFQWHTHTYIYMRVLRSDLWFTMALSFSNHPEKNSLAAPSALQLFTMLCVY